MFESGQLVQHAKSKSTSTFNEEFVHDIKWNVISISVDIFSRFNFSLARTSENETPLFIELLYPILEDC